MAVVRLRRFERWCSCCNFDYNALFSDRELREHWMLENIARGPTEQHAVRVIYAGIMRMDQGRAYADLAAFAESHGLHLGPSLAWRVGRGAIVISLMMIVLIVFVMMVALISVALSSR